MKISKLDYLTEEDLQVWQEINSTDAPYEDRGSVVSMFYEAVSRHANRPAISIEGEDLSYAELNNRSNRVARFLMDCGAKTGDTIAVAFGRNHHLYIAIMGILKAGCAYVPIETDFPGERIQHILRDSGAKCLLTEERFHLTECGRHLDAGLMQVVLDARVPAKSERQYDIEDVLGKSSENVYTDINSQSPIYIIYTSGSTGKPKGVKISHDNVANFVHWFCQLHDVTSESMICQNAPITFDPSAQQIFPALVSGATLLPIPEKILHDPYLLLAWLREERISHLDIVTPHWIHLLNALETSKDRSLGELPHLQWIIIGGESLYYNQIHQWQKLTRTPARFNNVYGPTEATINATFYLIDPEGREGKIPIGQPLPNYKIHILDQDGRLCPPHVIGEIYIGGRGVALGYQDPEQTRKNFLKDPFSNGHSQLLYKTGDLGRLIVADGEASIEFGGRIDSQVKISGYRIELEEIETTIKSIPEILDAAVIVWGNDLNKQLVCFFVSASIDQDELRKRLRAKLPAYMIPGAYMQLEKLSHTRNGKMDRNGLLALYEQEKRAASDEIVPPRNSLEALIANIWREMFNLDRVSVTSDFFKLGGNSFLALTFLTQFQTHLNSQCRIADIYEYPTIAELAAAFEHAWNRQETERAQSARKIRPQPSGPAARAQMDRATTISESDLESLAIEIMNPKFGLREIREIELSPGNQMSLAAGTDMFSQTIINVPLDFGGDKKVLDHIVSEIIDNHALLRVAVRRADTGEFKFVEYSFDQVSVPFFDLSQYADGEEENFFDWVRTLSAKPFRVTEPPLFRFLLIRDSSLEYRLVWWISHLISDGESANLIERELNERCASHVDGRKFSPPRLQVSYEQYVKDIRSIDMANLGQRIEYINSFMASLKKVESNINSIRSSEPFFLNSALTLSLEELPHPVRADMVSLLYSVCSRAIADCMGIDAVPFVSIYHGRDYGIGRRYFSLVGNLIDHVPILIPAKSDLTVEGQFAEIRKTMDVVDYRRINYAHLIEQISRRGGNEALAQSAADSYFPLRINFFEELESRQANNGDLSQLIPDRESNGRPMISFSITRNVNQFELKLFAWGIERAWVDRLWNSFNRQVNHFRLPAPAASC